MPAEQQSLPAPQRGTNLASLPHQGRRRGGRVTYTPAIAIAMANGWPLAPFYTECNAKPRPTQWSRRTESQCCTCTACMRETERLQTLVNGFTSERRQRFGDSLEVLRQYTAYLSGPMLGHYRETGNLPTAETMVYTPEVWNLEWRGVRLPFLIPQDKRRFISYAEFKCHVDAMVAGRVRDQTVTLFQDNYWPPGGASYHDCPTMAEATYQRRTATVCNKGRIASVSTPPLVLSPVKAPAMPKVVSTGGTSCGYDPNASSDDDDYVDPCGNDGCLDCSPEGRQHRRPIFNRVNVPSPATRTYPAVLGDKTSPRMVGIELEFNTRVNAGLQPWIDAWGGDIHSDGSCGWEAVTPPIAGRHVTKCVQDLCGLLRDLEARADGRCGIHVHVDARDLGWSDMQRLLLVYSLVEPMLYIIAGQHRAHNNYSMACGEAYGIAVRSQDPRGAILREAFALGSVKAGREKARAGMHKKDSGRYKGINIIPWLAGRKTNAPDCTVEFRMHRNSLDPKRVSEWALLCSRLVDYAVRASDSEVSKLPKSALRALCTIVPESKAFILKRVKAWRAVTTGMAQERYDDVGGVIPMRRIGVKSGRFYVRGEF